MCRSIRRYKQRLLNIDRIKVAENEWWLAECDKLKQASESEKWRIINRLTNQTTSVGIQPLKS